VGIIEVRGMLRENALRDRDHASLVDASRPADDAVREHAQVLSRLAKDKDHAGGRGDGLACEDVEMWCAGGLGAVWEDDFLEIQGLEAGVDDLLDCL